MPELPEVEIVRRGLEERILGLKIAKIEVLCEKSFQGESTKVLGRKVLALRRFGKALIIDLSERMSLMVHLRMTGQLIFDGLDDGSDMEITEDEIDDAKLSDVSFDGKKRYAAGHPSENFVAELPNKQTRVVFWFGRGDDESENNIDTGADNGAVGILYFNDQRKFGFIKVLATDEVENDAFIRKLAKEPWQMSAEEFYEKLQKHPHSAIKAVILDQSVIAGLGNIYADESLFMGGIHPEREAGTLTREEAKSLLESAREVMTKSIESGGSTMATYVKADGTRGNYLDKFAQVFRKEGQPCPKCGAEIVKIRVAGRGTHICPQCQKVEVAKNVTKKRIDSKAKRGVKK